MFVEVKTWTTLHASDLGYAISLRKQRRIAAAAEAYLSSGTRQHTGPLRFDVILVRPDGGELNHYEGAFEAVWHG